MKKCDDFFQTLGFKGNSSNNWALTPQGTPPQYPQPLVAGYDGKTPYKLAISPLGVNEIAFVPNYTALYNTKTNEAPGDGCNAGTNWIGISAETLWDSMAGGFIKNVRCTYQGPTGNDITCQNPDSDYNLCDRNRGYRNVCGTLDMPLSIPKAIAPLETSQHSPTFIPAGRKTPGNTQGLVVVYYRSPTEQEARALVSDRVPQVPLNATSPPGFPLEFKQQLISQYLINGALRAFQADLFSTESPAALWPMTSQPFTFPGAMAVLKQNIITRSTSFANQSPGLPLKDLQRAIGQAMVQPKATFENGRSYVYLPVPLATLADLGVLGDLDLDASMATNMMRAYLCETRDGKQTSKKVALGSPLNTFSIDLREDLGVIFLHYEGGKWGASNTGDLVLNSSNFTSLNAYQAAHPKALLYAASLVYKCPVITWSPLLLVFFSIENVQLPFSDNDFCALLNNETGLEVAQCFNADGSCSTLSAAYNCGDRAKRACQSSLPAYLDNFPEKGYEDLFLNADEGSSMCNCFASLLAPQGVQTDRASQCFDVNCETPALQSYLNLTSDACKQQCSTVARWVSSTDPAEQMRQKKYFDKTKFLETCGTPAPEPGGTPFSWPSAGATGGALGLLALALWKWSSVSQWSGSMLLLCSAAALALVVFVGFLLAGRAACDKFGQDQKYSCYSKLFPGLSLPRTFCSHRDCECTIFNPCPHSKQCVNDKCV